ncbi:uncharacterized protein LOC110056322 [Orbicella faveolata]|uniref:uncharacterized protein LOC110056322 n=1 Tax=Orbicella faveolata TaxID=48498 RepID=UPI0009E34273|nr:uncharacterized protein LOC110056322 [Orbicella faveolata]
MTLYTDFDIFIFFLLSDHALLGHAMDTVTVVDEFECQLKCIENKSCKSVNVHPDGNNAQRRICELNNKTRQMKQRDFKWKKGSTYYGSVQASCIDVSRQQNKQSKSGKCHPGYKGKQCGKPIKGLYSNQPAHSCKDIRDSGDSKGDGEYWIDPEKSGNPFKVYCDMTTDGGGWLLVSNVVIDNPSSPKMSVKTSYREISSYHNNQTFLTKSAMNELRTHLSFTQLRFHCSKQQGRTFHVTTVANSTGEAVVQYFSGQTDVQPDACGSFVRMENDNSGLAAVCRQWGYNGTSHYVGKWGWYAVNQDRLYNHVAYVAYSYHWLLTPDGSRWECDDYLVGVSSGDFWKVFVR